MNNQKNQYLEERIRQLREQIRENNEQAAKAEREKKKNRQSQEVSRHLKLGFCITGLIVSFLVWCATVGHSDVLDTMMTFLILAFIVLLVVVIITTRKKQEPETQTEPVDYWKRNKELEEEILDCEFQIRENNAEERQEDFI